MTLLNTQPNFGTPGQRPLHAFTPGDDFYEALIETHRGLGDDASRLLNARLVLLLANHIGDLRVLREAMAAARAGLDAARARRAGLTIAPPPRTSGDAMRHPVSTPQREPSAGPLPGRPAIPSGDRPRCSAGEGLR